MSVPGRPILRRKPQTLEDDREFRIDLYDVLLPCRQFLVAHKVAEVGAVSLVTEFLLRLIHAVDRVDESAAAAFFGFDTREMNFALADLEAKSYVDRHDGILSLTDAGRALFQYGQETPQIYTVQKRAVTQGFDLLSFAPQDNVRVGGFESRLDELSIDAERVSTASREIRTAFRNFFGEISARTDKDGVKHLSLYSIDSVVPARRFSAPISFYLKARTSRTGAAEADLSGWRTPQEIDDRPRIVESIAAHIEKLKAQSRPDDKKAYSLLSQLGGDFFKDFTRQGELAVERYFSSALTRAGELRVDRPTVPIVGTFFVEENTARLTEALQYGKKALGENASVPGLCWLIPDTNWGHTHVLPTVLGALSSSLASSPDNGFQTVSLAKESLRPHQREAFSVSELARNGTAIPSSLELLWIPGVLAAALVHAPVKTRSGIPIPLGFLSFNSQVIARIEEFLKANFSLANAMANAVGPNGGSL